MIASTRSSPSCIGHCLSGARGTPPSVLKNAAENAPGGAQRAADGSRNFRAADPRMIAHGYFDNASAGQRATKDQFDGPPVARLTEIEVSDHVGARSAERPE